MYESTVENDGMESFGSAVVAAKSAVTAGSWCVTPIWNPTLAQEVEQKKPLFCSPLNHSILHLVRTTVFPVSSGWIIWIFLLYEREFLNSPK